MTTPVTIGEHAFVVGLIPAMKAPKAFRQLIKIAGPVMGEIVKALGASDVATLDVKKAVLDGKLNSIIEKAADVDDDALLELMLTLAEHSTFNGKNLKLQFDFVFTGKHDLMIKWFVEAVKINFGSFWKSMETNG